MKHKPSPNFDDRKQGRVKYLILHYTGMTSGQEAIERLCDPATSVSAHYVVEENGDIFMLVDEDKRAWHAGVSKWEGDTDINDLSIGIEIVNPGHPYPGYESVYRPFPDLQMKALIDLASEVVKRHHIKPSYILGHSDVAWRRKIDPGELFDWALLAKHNLGLWPIEINIDQEVKIDEMRFRQNLEKFGYDTGDGKENLTSLISAFQRHFRQKNIDGILDKETFLILETLLNMKISL
jgi:N-acetylmuramoyl-L-alanine amidase